MEQLTKRQIIALEMLKTRTKLISDIEDNQTYLIAKALDFADRFIDISEADQD